MTTVTLSPTASAVSASDFSARTTDPNYRTWTFPKMETLISVLPDEALVAITTEKQTGFTVLGRLVRAVEGGSGRQARVVVEIDLADGTTQQTAYFMPSVADAIVILAGDHEGRGAKWRALDAWRERKAAGLPTY